VEYYWDKAFWRASEIAVERGWPLPSPQDSTLRILDYPRGAGSAEHTDFDLFTLNAFRNCSNVGLPKGEVHEGELLRELCLAKPVEHAVARQYGRHQYGIVFFAMPPLDLVLPSGLTVGQWLDERKARSRV
jgi:hypothetical protein